MPSGRGEGAGGFCRITAGQGLKIERKLRLFFQLGVDGPHCPIAWFQIRDKDFYWGPGEDGADLAGQPFNGTSAKITTPEDFERIARAVWKASHHASGVVHVTGGSERQTRTDVWGCPLTSVSNPTRFAAVFTKHPVHMPTYQRSLTRRRSAAMVLRLPEERWAVRHYLEFFLTPAGTFSAVPTMLQMEPKRSVEPPLSQSFGEDVDLVLLVRHYAVGGEMSAWKPTASIWLVLDPASPEDGAPS